MGAAQKKRQIGFVTGAETKPETGNRKRLAGPLSEGPQLGLLRIRITQYQFNVVSKGKFVNLRLSSRDGKFALNMIVKDADSFLEMVPRRMPEIAIDMGLEAFKENVERNMIVMLEDGLGQSKGYKIAAIKQAELMNDGKWTPAKKALIN